MIRFGTRCLLWLHILPRGQDGILLSCLLKLPRPLAVPVGLPNSGALRSSEDRAATLACAVVPKIVA